MHLRAFPLRHPAPALLCAALVLALTGCETLDGQPVNLLSTAQEVRIGAQVAEQVEQQETLLENAAIQTYIDEIGRRLAVHAPRQDVAYVFKVIDSPDAINAFALPGGFLYLYTGLLKACDNEAELASVMAHEIAHVAARHHGESITRQYGMHILSQLILGDNPRVAAQVATDVLGTGIMARYSRENEREADRLGMHLLARAGYNPEAMSAFMEKLVAQEAQRGGRMLPLFASHPPSRERLDTLSALARQYPLELRREENLHAERYRRTVLNALQ